MIRPHDDPSRFLRTASVSLLVTPARCRAQQAGKSGASALSQSRTVQTTRPFFDASGNLDTWRTELILSADISGRASGFRSLLPSWSGSRSTSSSSAHTQQLAAKSSRKHPSHSEAIDPGRQGSCDEPDAGHITSVDESRMFGKRSSQERLAGVVLKTMTSIERTNSVANSEPLRATLRYRRSVMRFCPPRIQVPERRRMGPRRLHGA